MRIAGCARHRHQAPRGFRRIVVFWLVDRTAALAAARPVFSVLGREFIHLGPTGSGALMKLINNFMCGVQAASLAEAESMIDGRRPGSGEGARGSYSRSSGQRTGEESRGRASANDFTPNFPLHLMAKDLGVRHRRGFAPWTAAADRELPRSRYSRGDCQGLRRSGFFRGDQVANSANQKVTDEFFNLPRDADQRKPLPGKVNCRWLPPCAIGIHAGESAVAIGRRVAVVRIALAVGDCGEPISFHAVKALL